MELNTEGFGITEIQEAIDIARSLEDPALLARPLADRGAFETFGVPGDPEADFEAATAAARQAGDKWAAAHVLWWHAFYWVYTRNRPDRAAPLLVELETMGRQGDNVGCLRWKDVVVGMGAWHQGRLAEGRAAMERALEGSYECHDPLLEAYAVGWLTDVTMALGDYEAARVVVLRTAVRLRRSLDVCREGFVEFGLARLALAEGKLDEAARQVTRLADVLRTTGIPFLIEWLGHVEGRLALERGDLAAARAAFDEVWAMAEACAVPWSLVAAHQHRALLARAEGDAAAAEDQHHHALALVVEYGFRGAAADTLEGLAGLAAMGDSDVEATRLYAAAHALRQATGQTRWPLDQPAYEALLTELRATLGNEAFAQAWTEGTALSFEEAASFASRARGERKRPRSGWAALTPTELDVAALAARGLTNAEIGRHLFISPGTARIHLSHIYAKLGIANRAQLAAEATSRGIVRGG
jgi:DNA-binding CsgD family transcriptional regulator